MGFEHKFINKILFSVEGFFKDYFQYPIDLITGISLVNQGVGGYAISGASPVEFSGKSQKT